MQLKSDLLSTINIIEYGNENNKMFQSKNLKNVQGSIMTRDDRDKKKQGSCKNYDKFFFVGDRNYRDSENMEQDTISDNIQTDGNNENHTLSKVKKSSFAAWKIILIVVGILIFIGIIIGIIILIYKRQKN